MIRKVPKGARHLLEPRRCRRSSAIAAGAGALVFLQVFCICANPAPMRNTLLIGLMGSLIILGCGKTEEKPQVGPTPPAAKLPFTVITRSPDAVVEATRIGGSRVTVKMNAAALGEEQNYSFKLTLQEGGSVELRARAKDDLSKGVVLRFARSKDAVTMHINGQDHTADVKKELGKGDTEITVDIDIHNHSGDAHAIYAVNGKEGNSQKFKLVALQGNWGFVVEKAAVRTFAVGAAKHEH